jgi:hypothetical protein
MRQLWQNTAIRHKGGLRSFDLLPIYPTGLLGHGPSSREDSVKISKKVHDISAVTTFGPMSIWMVGGGDCICLDIDACS